MLHPLIDYAPPADTFLDDLLAGMAGKPKMIPPKYLYDAAGSALFERITTLPEYYPTRTELGIMERFAPEMAAACGPGTALVEYGSGSGRKTRLLLDALEAPRAYVPIDIAREHLVASAAAIADDYPNIEVRPICADFHQAVAFPDIECHRRVAYFSGSTIGNLDWDEAVAFLGRVRGLVGSAGGFLLGTDLIKDEAMLVAAYDDPSGITAQFNLNVLVRANRELDADFDLECFAHVAAWNPAEECVDIFAESTAEQWVEIAGRRFHLDAGERIHTESSHKYTRESVVGIADAGGFFVDAVWSDPDELFAVWMLRAG